MRIPNELGELIGHNPPDRASWYDVDDPRGERGTMVPLYTRFMRAFQGDPIGYNTVTSVGTTDVHGLGNVTDARTCVIYVSGNSILYRTDGAPPNPNGDQTIQQGSTVTLTGQPTILAFQFASAVNSSAVIYFTFYD